MDHIITALFVAVEKRVSDKIGNLCQKVFGNRCDDMEMSKYKSNYIVASNEESIRETEG